MKRLSITEFKAKCLALVDEISTMGEPIEILKRGKPIVVIYPHSGSNSRYPQEELKGSVKIIGDIISPVVDSSEWEVNKEKRKKKK